ncbi:hypothetical protein PR048_016038 [Dryococelus australis]|uniref:Reverse transcriptase/retrotransposon-derived protein RNase H-like domain-containing protein n=1 Tax=Dryococelus australis TaxID=614101 RepID=A0ABQ9HJ62_9NEOP|nr:hypothetical protein PR048_016038 [Dryococelus australis]
MIKLKLRSSLLYVCKSMFVLLMVSLMVLPLSETHGQCVKRLGSYSMHVFDRLEKANLSLSLEKYHFAISEVRYLGHVNGPSGLYPCPTNVKESLSFLGSCNYYCLFITSYATIAGPLTSLLKKSIKIVWTDKCKQSFIALINALTTSPVYAYPDFSKPFILATDASQLAIDSILSQVVNGEEHPVAYASRQFNNAETNCSVTDKKSS